MSVPGASRCCGRRSSRQMTALAGAVCLLATAVGLHANPPDTTNSLALAGGDQVLWIVTGEQDPARSSLLSWISRLDTSTLTLSPLRVQPLLGGVSASAEWNSILYVFVTNPGQGAVKAAHYSYDRTGESRRERRLPGDALPLALAGGSAELPGLWAVVEATVSEQVHIEWDEYQRSQQTQPAESGETRDSPSRPASESIASRPAVLPIDGTYLVVYDGSNWQPGFRAPLSGPPPARVWLAMSGGMCHLFWQAAPNDMSVHYAQRDKEAWQEMPPLQFPRPVINGCAGVLNGWLVFAALLADERGGNLLCEPRTLFAATHQWSDPIPLHQADGKPLVLPKDSVVSAYRDMLAILRRSDAGVEVGLWTGVSGRQVWPFTAVPTHRPEEAARSARLWEIGLLVAVGVVVMVYWWRRDLISTPAALPRGLALADLGRRGVAALIDMAPAGMIVGLIWHGPLSEYSEAVRLANENQETVSPSMAGLWLPWAAFVLMYSVWCTAFELRSAASPGKRLLRCTVMSLTGARPTPFQIVGRNAARFIELLPLLQFWPFLLLLFMTRNRQRFGDILARTIVAENVPTTEDAEDRSLDE